MTDPAGAQRAEEIREQHNPRLWPEHRTHECDACVLLARLRAVEGERDQLRSFAGAQFDRLIGERDTAQAEARRLRAISTRLHEWMQQPMSYDETGNLIVTRGQRFSLMAIVEALTPRPAGGAQ